MRHPPRQAESSLRHLVQEGPLVRAGSKTVMLALDPLDGHQAERQPAAAGYQRFCV